MLGTYCAFKNSSISSLQYGEELVERGKSFLAGGVMSTGHL